MGNQAGKNGDQSSNYGGIFVKLDKDAVNPGDTLSGTIYVDLKVPYPGDKICLEVKGSEYVKWIEKEARHRPSTQPNAPPGAMETYYVDVTREATRDIIQNDLTVYDWIGKTTVPPGQYTFPFSFQIPPGLPGSFFFRRGEAVAEIKYSVEGYLKPETDNIQKLKHKLYLTMREVMQQHIQTPKELTLNKPLSTWCCLSAGAINLRTAFEKDAYAPGEEARMLTEIDNSKCSLNVDNVIFQLNQTIRLNANGHGRAFSFPIRTVNLGNIPAGQACLGDQRKSASIILPPGQEGTAKEFNAGASYQDPDPTQIITPSAHGKLVQSDFSLSLTCSVDVCCDSVPSVSMPIQVYAAIKAKQPDPIPPPNWNPTPMPQANLTITIVQLANGGQEIHIDTGAPNPNPGMTGNQMPPQPQQGFGQPNQQAQPQMQPAKPMNDPNQFNNSQQPLMNNSYQQPMNNSYQQPQQPMNTGYQQPMNAGYQQPVNQPMNNGYQQPMNNGYPVQQPMPQQQPVYNQQPQPQVLNPQPVQIGQYNQPGYNAQPQYNQQPGHY